jgi:CRP-like cAMP-binding protein
MSRATDVGVEFSRMALFSDATPAELEEVAQAFEEQWYEPGERALRQGFVGSGFHVILEGQAQWLVDGRLADRSATVVGTKPLLLSTGDHFGELSVLFDEPAISDVVSVTQMRCAVLPGRELEPFLVAHPRIMYRLLLAEARRLRDPMRWRA